MGRAAVIGGCGGIGRAVVSRLRERHAVAVLDLPETLSAAPPGDVEMIAFDGRDARETARALDVLAGGGPLDALVLASGYAGPRAPLAELEDAIIDDVLAGNLRLPMRVLARLSTLMADGGAVVLLTTDMVYAPQPGYAPYLAAKAGLIAAARAVAKELAPRVRVNLVAPGAVDTAFLRGGLGRGADPAAPLRFDPAAYLAQVPMARMADGDDVAGPVMFLLSEEARYLTGEVLHVSGGAVMA